MIGPGSKLAPSTLGAAIKLGARLGLKWIAIIFGPMCLLGLLAAYGYWLVHYWFGEGNQIFTDPALRWQMLRSFGSPFGFFLVSCMWGIVAGLLVTIPSYAINRIRGTQTSVSESNDK